MLEKIGKNYNNIFPFLQYGKSIIKKQCFYINRQVKQELYFQKKAKIEIMGEGARAIQHIFVVYLLKIACDQFVYVCCWKC